MLAELKIGSAKETMKKKAGQQKVFSKEEMAIHAYEVLNLIVGDILSAMFLDASIEKYEKESKDSSFKKTLVVSLQRNKNRLIASALYRYTLVYKNRLAKIDLNPQDKKKAESLNQKLHNHQVEKLRHLFEHELSQFTEEPYSPEQVKERYKSIEPLISPNFRDKCHELNKRVQGIRDSVAVVYPDCGKGVDRWKVLAEENGSTLGHDAATATASSVGYDKVYGNDES
jgi:hypothetical protein